MTENDKKKVLLNKITLFIAILSVIVNILLATSSPIFEDLFKGKLQRIKVNSSYPEKYKNSSYYLTIFKYRHIEGRPIHRVTLDHRVMNTGSNIDYYEPFFKTLYNKKQIKQEHDKKYVRLEIEEIRPNDEFDIKLYTKNVSNIKAIARIKDGYCIDNVNNSLIRKPTVWFGILIVAFFVFYHIYYRRTIKSLEAEKHRIIGEQNALQQVIMSGKRISTGGRV